MKKIIKMALPLSFEQSSRSVRFLIMIAIVASFGTITLASYGIGMRIMSLIIIPSLSLSIVNSTLVAHNFGAGKIERAEKIVKISLILGFLVLTLLGVIFFIFAEPIIKIFIPNDLEVISMGVTLIRIVSLFFGFTAIQMTFYGAFRGSGNVKTTMNLSLLVSVFQILLALILSRYMGFGELGLWWSMPISNVFGALVGSIIYMRGKWRETRVI